MDKRQEAAIKAMRECEGGIGESLSEAQKRNVIFGLRNEPENMEPFDKDKFRSGLRECLENNPIDWVKS